MTDPAPRHDQRGEQGAHLPHASLASFRTHDLDVLLALSGRERHVRARHLVDWSALAAWDPEVRYKLLGSVGKRDAEHLLRAAAMLLTAV